MNWQMRVLNRLVMTICLAGICVASCPDALHKTGIAGYALSPDAAYIVAIAQDGAFFLWDVASGKRTQVMECVTPEMSGHPILFGPDSNRFAIKMYGAVRIYEVPSGRVLARLTSLKQKSIENLVFSGDGLRLAAADHDGATVWDTETQAETASINEVMDPHALALNHDGTLLAVSGRNGIELWDLTTGTMKRKVKLEEKQGAESLIFVEKDRWIAAATATTLPVESPKQKFYKYRRQIGIWSTASGKFVKSMRGQTEELRFPMSAAPPHALLSVDYEDTLRIWNLKTGRLEARWATPPGHPSRDGKLLLREGTTPGRLELWKIGSPDNEAREFVYRSPLCAKPFVGGSDDKKPEFKGLIIANGWIEDGWIEGGGRFTTRSYVAQDCSLVDTTLSDFKTPERATQYLERLAGKAAEVIETGLPKDAWERVFLGKRMVVRFTGRRSASGLFVVMWVEGRYVHEISSMSLPLALAMEREYFPIEPK